MAITYRIYSDAGDGSGVVDYSTPLDEVSASPWVVDPPPAQPSDTTYAVRAYDGATLLEEKNTDARARVAIDAAGDDLTGLPNAPNGLTARATASGGIHVAWRYTALGQGGAPTGFNVYAAEGAIDYGDPPAETVAYGGDRRPYTADLAGMSDGVLHRIGVRSYNADGEESNEVYVEVTADATGPLPVEGLAGEPVVG